MKENNMYLKDLVANNMSYDSQLLVGISGSAKGYVLSQLQSADAKQIIYITHNMLQANQVYDDLQFFLPNQPSYLYPIEESLAAEFATASKDFVAQRVEALAFLSSGQAGIVVAPVAAIQQLLSPKELFAQHIVPIRIGQELPFETLIQQLKTMGYTREKMVQAPGQFSVRGGIVDIYTLNEDNPVRIEFFDTEIDSIRSFDAETQRSLEPMESLRLLPATDVLFDSAHIIEQSEKLTKKIEKAIATVSDTQVAQRLQLFFNSLLTRWQHGELSEQPTLYTDLLYNKPTNVLDYLQTNGLIVIDDYARIMEQVRFFEKEEADWQVTKVKEGVLLPKQKVTVAFKDSLAAHEQRKLYLANLQKGLGRLKFEAVYPFQYRAMPQFFSQMPLIKTEMDHWLKQQMTIVVVVSDEERVKKVQQTFADFNIDSTHASLSSLVDFSVNVVTGALHSGFELPLEKIVFLNERELFNKVTKLIPKRQKLSNAERIKSYSELVVGDYVVHVNHGIGVYKGMETLTIGDVKQDYMSIIYQDDAKLFIPVTQIHLVQKYVASDGRDPKVNKLGGAEWAKTKKKVARKIEDIADELIALYAQREAEKGYAYAKDTPEQHEFEEAFPYVETADQLRSVSEIKRDMERDKPMDRLLVGDVGYGKTEVAMRAIFKAVQEGKQVAFLVPTTILAQQHYMTLLQRFDNTPFVVNLLSRFRTKAQQEKTLADLASGKVDIVVGTHRLVSQDVDFADLGLLIIDEEQRFGVKHKERLKQLRSQVDVLTLTATPIPRTLHMSMLGVRDLSVIETPPANRYPVQTYVTEQDDSLVRDSIERELARGGQVFYLYNRVETIQEKAEHIRQLVPDARVVFAHGQMSEVTLENILMDFMAGEYDVLVTTTIIETGVDMPNVNTLFIEDADRMGLSQLYQLRGRVGRTNRVAYAYFMFQRDKSLSETSEKRLDAIKEFTQLGSGFKIAMRDLSIRGAGNLLGQQQHGFIDSVGFDLYSEMLKEAVHMKRTGEKVQHKNVEIDLAISAYLPDSYIDDERQKIDIYKRIRTMTSIDDYRDIQDDLIDRFGVYPEEVSSLVDIGLIKYYAEEANVEKIKRVEHKVFITYTLEQSQKMSAPVIFEQLAKTTLKAQVSQQNQQTVIVFDIAKLPIDVWLVALQNYLKK